MLKLSVGIEMIFSEYDFLSRLDATVDAGLSAVEMWSWRDKDLEKLNERRKRLNVDILGINLEPQVSILEGNNFPALCKNLLETCIVAKQLNCEFITAHLQEVPHGPGLQWYSYMSDNNIRTHREKQKKNYISALKEAVPIAEDHGITLLLEPLNTLIDHSGYFLSSSIEALNIIKEVGNPSLGLLFDCYHQQISEGSLITNISRDMDLVKHIHLADAPGRHEPGTGEINFKNVLKVVKEKGYNGHIGLEYIPKFNSLSSLQHIKLIIDELNGLQ